MPFVGQVADCKDADGSYGAAGSVKNESLLGGVSEGCEKDAAKVAEPTIRYRAEHCC